MGILDADEGLWMTTGVFVLPVTGAEGNCGSPALPSSGSLPLSSQFSRVFAFNQAQP